MTEQINIEKDDPKNMIASLYPTESSFVQLLLKLWA